MSKKAKTASIKASRRQRKKPVSAEWQLKLYVAGMNGKSKVAFDNLHMICEQYLDGKYEIEVIDLLKQPQLAKGDQIFAVPTLLKQVPNPVRKIIGDLSNTEKVLVGLDLKPIGKS